MVCSLMVQRSGYKERYLQHETHKHIKDTFYRNECEPFLHLHSNYQLLATVKSCYLTHWSSIPVKSWDKKVLIRKLLKFENYFILATHRWSLWLRRICFCLTILHVVSPCNTCKKYASTTPRHRTNQQGLVSYPNWANQNFQTQLDCCCW